MAVYTDVPFKANGEDFITADDKIFRVKELLDYNVEIILYKNKAESNRVDKTAYLKEIGRIYGAFRGSVSITEPTIEIEYLNVPNFNYIYITQFDRYYFITDVASIVRGIWDISLSIDVLMSYKDFIRELRCFVDRNEFTYNPYLVDTNRIIEDGYNIEQTDITSEANRLFDPINKWGELDYPPMAIVTGKGLKIKEEQE